ncbi:alpha-galactosidase [Rugamonas sp. DEMB1]|uniref:alpha-galactosidase n=1 Tax=Rugamonas sp. DEMB1 TaxID=3039386 RepID=UPI00244ABF61|nr:alpha-galactosidase [Rugamonas sp. DEMB1]WGG48243.1 alpha-galactosidase [Rugamonas sp. DEMB1]
MTNHPPLPSSPAQFISLHGKEASLVLEVHADEAPLWRYWGPRLPDQCQPGWPLRETRPLPSFNLDFDQPLTLAPTFGVGWFGQSALLAHRDGADFAQAITHCEVEWLAPGRAVRLHLFDDVAQLRLSVKLSLDPHSDVLLMSSELQNRGGEPLDVQWLAAGTLPLPETALAVRSYAGQHNHEFLLQVEPLARGTWRRENRRGRTSHDCFPGAVITTAATTEHGGLTYAAHLAWSGNHQQSIEWLHDGKYQWQLGEWLAPGECRLAPGQTLQSPEIVATLSRHGLNGVAANFHAELRARLPWQGGAMKPRPVHLNTWEGFYFDHDLARLKDLADSAAAVGIERFVLDDGWFHGRHHDRAALGDWWPDAGKYPDGLQPLARHVVDLGMEFGLWFEPEMVNPDSELHRAHPDWALQLAGRPVLTARNQLVLDISRPEVAQYLFEQMDALLRALPISYIKWDHNRDLTSAGGRDGKAAYRAQVGAVYALMARLRAAHPALEIESCSGGGGRIDFAVLRHSHRVWTSDCIDAMSRVAIQRGFLQFFPPEIMGSHIGTAPAHSTGRSQAMAFRGAVALPGHLGVEFDLRLLEAQQRDELQGWIALYKQWRGLLHGGRVWQGEAGDGVLWQLHGDGDGDGADFLLLCYRCQPSALRYQRPAKLPMLDSGARYALSLVTPAGLPPQALYNGSAPFFEALRQPGQVELDGAWLAEEGLPLPRAMAETAFIVRLQRLPLESV